MSLGSGTGNSLSSIVLDIHFNHLHVGAEA